MDSIMVRSVDNADERSAITAEVLLDLPEWFGLSESTQNYIDIARNQVLFVAELGQSPIGFITLQQTGERVCEIYCMAVKKAWHRKGIGLELFYAFEKYAREYNDYIQVKTVDEGHYSEYDHTIAFYKRIGFQKMEVFPELWDRANPCLIMIKAIHRKEAIR